jgi:hypothetical protein
MKDKLKELKLKTVWNASLSLLVLACNLILSYSHSVQLLQLAGMVGVFAHIGVVAIEAIFFQSSLNIMIARFKGNKIGIPNVLGTIMGLALVWLSNIHYGKQFGILGIIIGATIPLGILVSEAMLSKEVIGGEEKAEPKEKPKKAEKKKKPKFKIAPDVDKYFSKYLNEFGKLPSIRETMKACNISKWFAERSLETKREVSS